MRKSRGEQERRSSRIKKIVSGMRFLGMFWTVVGSARLRPRRTAEAAVPTSVRSIEVRSTTCDCKQTGALVRHERAGGDLAVEFGGPAAGDLVAHSWGSGLRESGDSRR